MLQTRARQPNFGVWSFIVDSLCVHLDCHKCHQLEEVSLSAPPQVVTELFVACSTQITLSSSLSGCEINNGIMQLTRQSYKSENNDDDVSGVQRINKTIMVPFI